MADETVTNEQQEVVCGTCGVMSLFMCHDPEPLPDGRCGRCGVEVNAHHPLIPAPVVPGEGADTLMTQPTSVAGETR